MSAARASLSNSAEQAFNQGKYQSLLAPLEGRTFSPGAAGLNRKDFDLEALHDLAKLIVDDSRASLMMAYRFLDMALWRMPVHYVEGELAFATDGRELFVDPFLLVLRYRTSPDEVMRDLLHVILHCILRQPLDLEHIDLEAWELACDIVVESIAVEIAKTRYASALDEERERLVALVRCEVGDIVPNRIYRWLLQIEREFSQDETNHTGMDLALEMIPIFARDSHQHWAQRTDRRRGKGFEDVTKEEKNKDQQGQRPDYLPPENGSPDAPDDEQSTSGESDMHDAQNEPQDDSSRSPEASEVAPQQDDAEERDVQDRDQDDQDQDDQDEPPRDDLLQELPGLTEEELEKLRDEWEDIGKQAEMDLSTWQAQQASTSEGLVKNLRVANRKTYNYKDFLRRFCAQEETIKPNDDEFDYIFYKLGFDLYGDMPLVEPLEYQDAPRVREFVVAIDTSASTSGALVSAFVQYTYDILKEQQAFGREINVHIVQCDYQVRQDKKLTCAEDVDAYLSDFALRGQGSTDFRPVFDYVQELIEKGEFGDLGGLIYFTDGKGVFPDKKPPYESAFVFVDDIASEVRVPPWASKVVLTVDELERLM